MLGVALIPILRALHLPLRFDWVGLGSAFWLVLAVQSIFVTTLLIFVGFPASAFIPSLRDYWSNKSRILLILVYFLILGWQFRWAKAVILTVDTVVLLAFHRRLGSAGFRKALNAVLWPALYLFAGFLLIFAYNDVVASVRFNFANDPTFDAIDRWLLRGWSVPYLSHWAIRTFPVSFFHFLEFIYFGMFTQIGAGLILTALCVGRHRALQFVGAILTAYYVTLIVFYAWPSQGPYYLCPDHFAFFPSSLQAYAIQKALISKALALWRHAPIHYISTDYFMPFPCMHIAQPLIVMWFLRRWRRIVLLLAAYDVLLVIAIILLEWHYFVDILAAVPMACISIAAVDGGELWNTLTRRAEALSTPVPLISGTS